MSVDRQEPPGDFASRAARVSGGLPVETPSSRDSQQQDLGIDQSVFVEGDACGESDCSAQIVLPVYVWRVPQAWVS